LIQSVYPLFGTVKPDAPERERALALGLALRLASMTPSHRSWPLDGFARSLLAAFEVGQLRVYVNAAHECVGYVAWATLTPDVAMQFAAGKPGQLAEWECSDGTCAWILDFLALPGCLGQVMADLRDVVFKEYEQVDYYRIKGRMRRSKRVSRNDRTSFMAVGRRAQEAVA